MRLNFPTARGEVESTPYLARRGCKIPPGRARVRIAEEISSALDHVKFAYVLEKIT